MAFTICEPCIGTKDTACVDCLSGRLHPSPEGRRRVRVGGEALVLWTAHAPPTRLHKASSSLSSPTPEHQTTKPETR